MSVPKFDKVVIAEVINDNPPGAMTPFPRSATSMQMVGWILSFVVDPDHQK